MKVLQILPRLQEGGVERGVVELNRELVRRSIESHTISFGGKLVKQLVQDGGAHTQLDVASKNILTAPWRVAQLRRELRKIQPDVVDVRSRVPAWLFHFANKTLRLPWVTSVHGFNSVGFYSRIMTRGDLVVCVSNPVSEYIQLHYPVEKARIRVVHRGLDPETFHPGLTSPQKIQELKAELQIPAEARVALVSGRITRLKGIDTFLKGLALARQTQPQLYGLIVGGAAEKSKSLVEELKQQATSLGLEKFVQFAGSRSDLPTVYAMADILISCSRKPESFGRSLLEAMAMGTPVLSAKQGGALDIIREGENGLFFEANDAESLARSLTLSLETLWSASAIQKFPTQKFGLAQMVGETLNIYFELC